jgi:uncharacterized protein YegL
MLLQPADPPGSQLCSSAAVLPCCCCTLSRWHLKPSLNCYSTQLGSITAFGGDDGPEDVLGALHQACQLDWQAKARFAVLITDAPAHGSECNDDPDDSYRQGVPGHTVASCVQQLRQKKIELMMCKARKGKLEKMEQAFRKSYDDPAENRKILSVDLFDGSKQAADKMHLVFCLDGSTSMSGSPWSDLMQAYQQLLSKRRNDQGVDDYVSVVVFNDRATIIVRCTPLRQAPQSVNMPGGDTNFAPPLTEARALIGAMGHDYNPVLIFMSDGDNGDKGAPEPIMQEIYRQYSSRNLQVHTIGFGNAANSPTLKQLA